MLLVECIEAHVFALYLCYSSLSFLRCIAWKMYSVKQGNAVERSKTAIRAWTSQAGKAISVPVPFLSVVEHLNYFCFNSSPQSGTGLSSQNQFASTVMEKCFHNERFTSVRKDTLVYWDLKNWLQASLAKTSIVPYFITTDLPLFIVSLNAISVLLVQARNPLNAASIALSHHQKVWCFLKPVSLSKAITALRGSKHNWMHYQFLSILLVLSTFPEYTQLASWKKYYGTQAHDQYNYITMQIYLGNKQVDFF